MLIASQVSEASVLSFSTESVATSQQLDAWEEVVAGLHGSLSFEGSRAIGYRGALVARRCDAIQLVAFDGAQAASSRSEKQARADNVSGYELALVTRGDLELDHCGHSTRLRPGDGVLVDMSQPHQMRYRQSLSALFIACDRPLLDANLPGVTSTCGIVLPREGAALTTLLGYAGSVMTNLAQWRAHEFARVMAHLVELTALVLDGQNDLSECASSTQAALLHRIKQFIHAHLADDRLSLSEVAATNGISMRYMQKLFQIAGGSPREYLLEARLLRARTLLRQRPSRHTVSTIAYMSGFGSASYFSTAYKRRFGVAAREDARAEYPEGTKM